jgi:hypothetical protein
MGTIPGTQEVQEQTEEQKAEQQAAEAQSTETAESGQEAAEEASAASTEQESTEGKEGAESESSPLWDGVPDDHPLREHVKSLNAEAAAKRVENRSLRENLETLQSQLSEAKTPEEFQAAVDEYKQKLDETQVEVMRERVARKFGLPDPLAERLRGSTEEELTADAESLRGLIGAPTPPATPKNPPSGGLTPGNKAEDPAARAERIRKRRF